MYQSRRLRRTALLALPAALIGLYGASMLPARASGTSVQSTSSLTTLPDHVPGLSTVQDLGAADPTSFIQVELTFGHDMSAISAFEASLYDPKNANYHRFLTPAQFQERFGAAPAAVASARHYATAHGMKAVNPTGLGDVVLVAGSVSQAEQTFGVQIHNYRDARGYTFFANTSDPHVPAGLGLAGVIGLTDVYQYHLAQQGGCLQSGSYCTGAMSPQDLWTAYEQPGGATAGGSVANPNGNTTLDFGQGQAVAIIGAGRTDTVVTALREFEKTRQLPQVPVQVYKTDGGALTDDSGRIEWELDSQAITGMAPDISQLRLYFASNLLLTSLTTSLATWASDPQGPAVANASLGICEDSPALDPILGAPQTADETVLAQAAIEGRTLFAASGDTGSGCLVLLEPSSPLVDAIVPPAPVEPPPASPPVNGIVYGEFPFAGYPAASPNAVAVGGTSLYTDPTTGARVLERAWDHTGGEPSEFLKQPDFQGSVDLLSALHCVSQPDGSPYTDSSGNPTVVPCRGIVDVSALSDDETGILSHRTGYSQVTALTGGSNAVSGNGYDMVDYCPPGSQSGDPSDLGGPACAYNATPGTTSDHFSEGGTSLSSPLWAGMWARVLAASTSPLGFADQTIYPLAEKHSGAFYDVPAGSTNGAWPTISYQAGGPSGYDFPTGWGTPNLSALIAAVDKSTAPVNGSVLPKGSDPAPLPGSSTTADPTTNACLPLITGTKGSDNFLGQKGASPQLNILQVDMHDDTLQSAGSTLSTVITTGSPSETVPPPGVSNIYVVQWDYAGTTYATEAEVTADGGIGYFYGTMSAGQFVFAGYTTGSITSGPGGTGLVRVDVPLSDVGFSTPPKGGEVLTSPAAITSVLTGVPVLDTGFVFAADQAGPGHDYAIAETCSTNGAPGSDGAAA